MDDKLIMDNILTSTKSECDLLMHGTIESATPGVHTAFSQILNDTLCMQNEIYAKMTAKGWYPTQNAEQQKKCSFLKTESVLALARGNNIVNVNAAVAQNTLNVNLFVFIYNISVNATDGGKPH